MKIDVPREIIHKYIHIFSLCLLVLNIAVSEYVTSISLWIMLTNWIFNIDYKSKKELIKKNKGVLFFLLLFLCHIIWLINTNDFNYALRDIRIKLPLLAFPLIIGTTKPISQKELVVVIKFFVLGLLISTITGVLNYYGTISIGEINSFRDISIFISHIRQALLICLAIFILLYYIDKKLFTKTAWKIAAIISVLWLTFFLILSQSFTGIIILIVIGVSLIIIKTYREKNRVKKLIYLFFITGFLLTAGIYLTFFIYDFYTPCIDNQKSPEYTTLGNKYTNYYENTLIENGNYIYRNISIEEIYATWPKRSNMHLDSVNLSGQKNLHTLLRYMTSKGLYKDAEGIMKLSDKDIKAIESGATNYRFVNNSSFFISKRLYSILWQIDVYLKGGNPSGHSITQRIEYLKAGLVLAYENFWVGTGTGDVDDAFKEYYSRTDSKLDTFFRHRAHNQYFTFFISFGVFGALLCFIAIFFPVYLDKGFDSYYFKIFFAIALLSMINEDTLETMIGVFFFSFFYSLFLWGYDKNSKLI